MQALLDNLLFIFQRFTWTSLLDILLVAVVFYIVLVWLQGTRGMAILRGVLLLVVGLGLLINLLELPAFSWLWRTILPALLLAIPVIFAPELRQALERVGRLGAAPSTRRPVAGQVVQATIDAVTTMAESRIGALIVFERTTSLGDYLQTGVLLDALASPELILQIFYPNTPLHDGALIIGRGRLQAAACVLPLTSATEIPMADGMRRLGLRHRAAIGITEVSDALVVVVSEETGMISVARDGYLIWDLKPEQVRKLLLAGLASSPMRAWFRPWRLASWWRPTPKSPENETP